jgi:GNAT superfamily N-acetyltransferase
MKLINLIPLQEIDFASQGAFDTYNKAHKLRPDTKVKIAGKTKGKNQQPAPIIYVARDCKRSEIWRNEIYPEYKGTRESDPNFSGAPFFKLAYQEQLFEKTYQSNYGCNFFVATLSDDDNKVVGCVALKRHSQDEGELCRMAVDTTIRSNGIGSQLVNHLFTREFQMKQK